MAAESDDNRAWLLRRLFKAIHDGNIEEVRHCIRREVDLKEYCLYPYYEDSENPACPLAHACCQGQEEIMNELLIAGADPNQLSGLDQPVMHMAAEEDRLTLSMIQSLMTYGADVNDVNFRKMLEGAAERCNIDTFNVLLDAGANRQLTPNALIKPCYQNDHAMLLRILDSCDVDINMVIDGSMTILHYSCNTRDVNSGTVRLLLDHGTDARTVSGTGDTALHYAVDHCNCSKIFEILTYNPPLCITNNTNQTPLVKLMRSRYNRPSFKGMREPRPRCFTMQERCRNKVLAFKMLIAAGANVPSDFEQELHNLCLSEPMTQISDYEISSIRSLQEMCRLVIRGTIPVPIFTSAHKLPIPELLQSYLNVPEFDPLVEEYIKTSLGKV